MDELPRYERLYVVRGERAAVDGEHLIRSGIVDRGMAELIASDYRERLGFRTRIEAVITIDPDGRRICVRCAGENCEHLQELAG